MQDSYLFRGKRLDNGEWVYGYYRVDRKQKHLIYPHDYSVHNNTKDFMFECFDVNPATIGRCTGLHAAKSYRGDSEADRLVFEGDVIVSLDGHDSEYSCEGIIEGEVCWDKETLSFQVSNRIEAESYEILGEDNETLEIIDNIHDRTGGSHMLSKEEHEAIRARCEAVINGTWDWDKWPDGNEQIYKQDVFALLDSSEELKKQTYYSGFTAKEWAEKGARVKESLEKVLASYMVDRDEWKARALALERAIKKSPDTACELCIGDTYCRTRGRAVACTLAGWQPDGWQFDESRFAGGDVRDGTEGERRNATE